MTTLKSINGHFVPALTKWPFPSQTDLNIYRQNVELTIGANAGRQRRISKGAGLASEGFAFGTSTLRSRGRLVSRPYAAFSPGPNLAEDR